MPVPCRCFLSKLQQLQRKLTRWDMGWLPHLKCQGADQSPQISQGEEMALYQPKPNITTINVSTGSRKTHPGIIPFLYSFDLLIDS